MGGILVNAELLIYYKHKHLIWKYNCNKSAILKPGEYPNKNALIKVIEKD